MRRFEAFYSAKVREFAPLKCEKLGLVLLRAC
jgi:hypothetical protein